MWASHRKGFWILLGLRGFAFWGLVQVGLITSKWQKMPDWFQAGKFP
jgi:hypothetical protein